MKYEPDMDEREMVIMTLTTTFKHLRDVGACKSRYKLLRAALKGVKDTEPINLLTILNTNGLSDALWALRATDENCDKIARLMAADFAEEVLPIWHKYSDSKRPELAIKAARDFANGHISLQEMAAAGDAAWTAGAAACDAWAAWAACDAASAAWAAGEAAWAAYDAGAAEEKQIEIFTCYLQPIAS